jgi:hypothetical protein
MAARNWTLVSFAFVALCVAGQSGVASASPTFDVEGYSNCTVAVVPGGNVDDLATSCCVQQAGIPTDTRYGVGCIAPVDNPAPDYRPTVILPTRPVPPEQNQNALDGLLELPVPQPIDEAAPQP